MSIRTCSEPFCERPHVARGLCHTHYRRFLRLGGERKFVLQRHYGKTPKERFWLYVERGPRCWEWTGYKNAKGYGVLNLRGVRVLAHRMAYQMRAEIPDGMFVLHHCDNPGCVKFKHLFLGTLAENNTDMTNKGRRRHASKIDEKAVREIRASTESDPVVAARYGIDTSAVNRIRARLRWAHIE